MTRRVLFALSLFLAAESLHADAAVLALAQASYTFHEEAGTGAVTILRSGDKTVACSVSYRVSVNTVLIVDTVSFAANEVSKTVSFPIPNDNLYDNYDASSTIYSFSISNAVNAQIGSPSNATIKIIDDEALPTITLQCNPTVAEGNSGIALFPVAVTLSGPSRGNVFVDVYVIGGTATADPDFADGFRNLVAFLVFPQGETTRSFFIKIMGDNTPEPDETVVIGAGYDGQSVIPASATMFTILNDDYILTPGSQQVIRGTVGSLSVTTSVATPTTDHVELSSSDPGVVTVPPFVDIPAGSLGKSFDVTTVGSGSAVITATMPPSRGSVQSTARIDVYTPTLFTFDKPIVNVALSETVTVSAHFDPPPTEPVVLSLTQTFPSVATIPPVFTVGTNGIGTFSVRGTAIGVTVVSTTVPPAYGTATTGFRIDVSPAAGVAITRLDTASGPSTGGQRVTIFAAGMSARCSAMFDGVSGLSTSMTSSGSLTTSTPPHDAGRVDVSVRCGINTGTLPKAYTYTPVPAHLTRLSPTIGPAGGGGLVAATGENLRRGRCSLWFGGVTATTMQNDQTTSMLVAAPPHAPGSVDVTLRCGSDISTLAGAFLYTSSESPPNVTGVNPLSAAPGERIFIAGSAFRDDDAIFFDSTAGLDVTSTSDEHFVTVPSLPPGNVTITLRDVAGHTVAGPIFRVLTPAAPQITSAPTHILTSSEFPVTGSGFRRDLNFLLGGIALQTIAIASTFGQLRLPPSIGPGTYDLTLANQSGVPRTIQVTDGIAVTSVSIPCSSTEGGLMATIRGNGFAAGAVVAFGAADSSDVTVMDAHTISARVPPSSGLANETITVTNPNGDSAQLSNAFHYRWPDPGCGTTRHRGATH